VTLQAFPRTFHDISDLRNFFFFFKKKRKKKKRVEENDINYLGKFKRQREKAARAQEKKGFVFFRGV